MEQTDATINIENNDNDTPNDQDDESITSEDDEPTTSHPHTTPVQPHGMNANLFIPYISTIEQFDTFQV
eukprot:15232897-Ditylum_brightwellii.AAC.2